MKYRITYKRYHASSVHPDVSEYLFTFRKVKLSFSPNCTDFPCGTLSDKRGAESNTVAVVAVVVVASARRLDVPEIVTIVDIRRAQEVIELNLY